MMLGTLHLEYRGRPRRPSRTYDCPVCEAVVVVRDHDAGGTGMTCRCCGWWRVVRADGERLEESGADLRQRAR